jgi:large subunit ribosomal protein L3
MDVPGLIGIKIGQSQGFLEDGTRVPLSLVRLDKTVVTQIKTSEKNGYSSVQLGLGEKKKVTKSLQGHFKKANLTTTPRYLKELRLEKDTALEAGSQVISEEVLAPGDIVKVIGTSKGKGYAGVVKKYHFKGGPKTHGQSDRHRAPGSSGQSTTPGRVYKGKRMSGRMGSDTVTIKNLQVIDLENGVLSIIGLIPGPRGSLVTVLKTGVNKKFKSIYKPQSADEIANNQVEPDVIAETESVVEEQNSEVPSEAVEVKPDSQIDLVEVSDESSETPVEEAKAENAPSETEEVKEDVEETK